MRCPNCGFEGEGKFCAQCGAPLEEMSIVRSDDPVIPAEEAHIVRGDDPVIPAEEARGAVCPLPEAEAPLGARNVSPGARNVSPGPRNESPGARYESPGARNAPNGGAPFRSEPQRQEKRGIGARFGAFWHKNKRNKVLVIIAALILISIVRSIIGGIGSPDMDAQEVYDWPDNDISQMIPEPEGTLTYVSTTNGEFLNADVNCTEEQCKTFIDGCKEMGFDKKQDVIQDEGSYDYEAENKDAYKLSASYYDGELSIYLNAPEEETEEEEEVKETVEPEKETTAEKKEKKSSGGVDPDFKETMDEYEAFMNDYVDFMKKYENSDDTASMMVDYGKMMAQYAEFTEKIDNIDEDELSDADYAYYMKVTGRVTEKMAELY